MSGMGVALTHKPVQDPLIQSSSISASSSFPTPLLLSSSILLSLTPSTCPSKHNSTPIQPSKTLARTKSFDSLSPTQLQQVSTSPTIRRVCWGDFFDLRLQTEPIPPAGYLSGGVPAPRICAVGLVSHGEGIDWVYFMSVGSRLLHHLLGSPVLYDVHSLATQIFVDEILKSVSVDMNWEPSGPAASHIVVQVLS